jgi:hypothetical protein
MFSPSYGKHGYPKMRMFGAPSIDGVNFFADFVEHNPIVLPVFDPMQALLVDYTFLMPRFIRIAQGNHIVGPCEVGCVAGTLSTDTYASDIEFTVWRRASR